MAGEAYPKQFRDLTKIFNGTTPASDLKMSDIFPIQHVDSSSATNTLNQVTVAQCLCQPVAVVNNTPSDGRYTADCVNFPDFSIRDTDNNHILYGLKVRVSFPNGITYGSVSGGTCPELNINGSGSLKMLAQGKTMAAGAASAGQTMEFTLIPYGNGEIAWDADSNVRESTSDYTIYTDGATTYKVINRKLLRYYGSVAVGEQVLDESMNWWNVRDKLIFSINYAMNSAGTNSQNDIMIYPKNDGKLYLNIAHSYQVLDMGGVALILP